MDPHSSTFRVYCEDTDFSGRVYHANYLRFFERGRTEFLRAAGVEQTVLHRDGGGLIFVVGRIGVDYLRPAAMDDLLTVATRVERARGPIIAMDQKIHREGVVLARATVTIVAVREGRPARLPATVLQALAKLG